MAWAARLVWAGAVLVAAVPEAAVVAEVVAAAAEVVSEAVAGRPVGPAAEAAPTHSGAGRLTGSSRPSATGGARNRRTPVRYFWT